MRISSRRQGCCCWSRPTPPSRAPGLPVLRARMRRASRHCSRICGVRVDDLTVGGRVEAARYGCTSICNALRDWQGLMRRAKGGPSTSLDGICKTGPQRRRSMHARIIAGRTIWQTRQTPSTPTVTQPMLPVLWPALALARVAVRLGQENGAQGGLKCTRRKGGSSSRRRHSSPPAPATHRAGLCPKRSTTCQRVKVGLRDSAVCWALPGSLHRPPHVYAGTANTPRAGGASALFAVDAVRRPAGARSPQPRDTRGFASSMRYIDSAILHYPKRASSHRHGSAKHGRPERVSKSSPGCFG